MNTKQVIVMRKDLNMRKGKIAAQAAHASMGAILNLAQSKDPGRDFVVIPLEQVALRDWLNNSFTKICVSVDSEEELLAVYAEAEKRGMIRCLITDNGLTEFNGVPTKTCCAIGPAEADEFIGITDKLSLL